MTYVYKCLRCTLEFALCLFVPDVKDVPFPTCPKCNALNPELIDFDPKGSQLDLLRWEIENLYQRVARLEELWIEPEDPDPTKDMVSH